MLKNFPVYTPLRRSKIDSKVTVQACAYNNLRIHFLNSPIKTMFHMVNGEIGISVMYIFVDNVNRIFIRSCSTYIKINKNKCFFT